MSLLPDDCGARPRPAAPLAEHVAWAACRARVQGREYPLRHVPTNSTTQTLYMVKADGTYRTVRSTAQPTVEEQRALQSRPPPAPAAPAPTAPPAPSPPPVSRLTLPRQPLRLATPQESQAQRQREAEAARSVPCPSGWTRNATTGTCVPQAGRGSTEQAREYQKAIARAHESVQGTPIDPFDTGDRMSFWGDLLDAGGEIFTGLTGIDLSPVGIGFPDNGGTAMPGTGAPGGATYPPPTTAPTVPYYPGGAFPGGTLVPTQQAGPECPPGTLEVLGRCVDPMAAAPGGRPLISQPQPAQPPTVVAAGTQIACPSGFHPNKQGYYTQSEGWIPKGSKCVRNRRRNALNPRAAKRSLSRLRALKKSMDQFKGIRIPDKC